MTGAWLDGWGFDEDPEPGYEYLDPIDELEAPPMSGFDIAVYDYSGVVHDA